MSSYAHKLDIGLSLCMCGLGSLVQIIIFIYIFFIFCVVKSMYNRNFEHSVYLPTYISIVPHSYKYFYGENFSKNIFLCINLFRVKEREKHSLVR